MSDDSGTALSLDFVATVKERYERWLPERLDEIPEDQRDSFYSSLAEEIAQRVQSLELALRGPGPEDEPFMKRLGRFNMARLQAIEMALAELLPTPEPKEDPEDLLPITDLGIEALHGLYPEDEGYEVEMESWRQHYRQKGNYVPTEPTA